MKMALAKLMVTTALVWQVPCQASASDVPAQPNSGSVSVDAPGDLETGFRVPPQQARPRVWWHWMNGNISKEGIRADIAWMKRVGIGGLQNFDVDLATQQIVDKRLVYMTPEWKDAFRFAASEADRQGLELAIASSPGWSETGGPWVPNADGIKKVVWSETMVKGGTRKITLPQPPSVAGPYQDIGKQPEISDLIAGHPPEPGPQFYRDSRVVAMPVAPDAPLPRPSLTDGKGKPLEFGPRQDAISGITLSSLFAPDAPELRMDYGRPVSARSITLHMPGGAIPLLGPLISPLLQSSQDGRNWSDIATVPLEESASTIEFPTVSARYFRLVIKPKAQDTHQAERGSDPAKSLAMEDVFGKAIGGLLGKPVTIGLLQLRGQPRIDHAEVKAAFGLVPDYFSLPVISDGASGPAPDQVLDLTDRMKPDGTLDWVPPAGQWKILRFGYSLRGITNHPAPAEATGLEVDKYDGEAVARYMEHYLANYRDAAGPDMLGEHGVRALLTDSIEIGAANWTPRLIEQFKRLRGYDPLPWLPTLAGYLIGTRADSDRFLFDFRRTLSDLMSSEHYGTVARIAHEHGLKVYGESIEGSRSAVGDDLAMRRYTDFPMAAMWAFDARQGPQPSYVIDIKGAASVAHLYGQNIVAAESMTAAMAPWAFGPADLKHIVDQEFVLGVNRPVVHTSVHVPVDDRKPGLSLGGIGQFFNRNESWAELATPWVDYLSRNAFMLQQGRNVADVAYFYGEEAPIAGLYGNKLVPDAPTTHGFDYINVDALMGAVSNDGAEIVSTGGARYKAIYLGGSSDHMSLATLRRVAALVEGGANVIGMAPTASPGLGDDRLAYDALVQTLWSGAPLTRHGKGCVVASKDVETALEQLGVAPDLRIVGASAEGNLSFAHRHLADGDSYFLVNSKETPQHIEGHFRVTGKVPQLWHAETGAVEDVSYRIVGGETVVPLDLAGFDAVHVVFRKTARTSNATVPFAAPARVVKLDGAWRVEFQPGRGAPAAITMARLAPLNENSDPAVRYFSGIATYSSNFKVPPGWQPGTPLKLDLGEAREVAEVTVNGQLAGFAWHAPYQVDVGAFARRDSENTIRIRVANLWVNRMIRDADPTVMDKISWTSVPTYRPTAPLRPSGLIGPVSLTVPGK